MYTLPEKTSHIFLSGAVNLLIWSLIAMIVVCASLAIAIVIGPAWTPEVLAEVRWIFSDMQFVFSDVITPGYSLATIVYMLVTVVYGIIAPMSAVVLGATVAKKHKVLAIIGIMIGLSIVTSTVTGIISGISQFLMFAAEDNLSLYMSLTPLLSSIFLLLLSVGGYILSVHFMKMRLNLP